MLSKEWFGVGRRFVAIWSLFAMLILSGCQSLAGRRSVADSRQKSEHAGIKATYRIETLSGSAVVYHPESGHQRVRWRLTGQRGAWQLAVYDVIGFRLLRLAKNEKGYELQDRHGKLKSDSLAEFWQERRLPVMLSEALLDELWRMFEVEESMVAGDLGIVRELFDGWKMRIVKCKWYANLKRSYPNMLHLERNRVTVRLSVGSIVVR